MPALLEEVLCLVMSAVSTLDYHREREGRQMAAEDRTATAIRRKEWVSQALRAQRRSCDAQRPDVLLLVVVVAGLAAAQRRRAMADYQQYAQARQATVPVAEGKRAVFISWSCQSCGFRNNQLIYVCFK